MINTIKSFFTRIKLNRLKNEIDHKYKKSVDYQRNGKLREYAQTLQEVQALEKSYEIISKDIDDEPR